MTHPPPQPVDVHGGAAGITAVCEQIVEVAREFGHAAADSLHSAWSLHGYLVNPTVTTSAVLDPIGYARFESALLNAVDGLGGLTWVGGRCGLLEGELRLAATAYASADNLVTALGDKVTGLLKANAAISAALPALSRRDYIGAADALVSTDPELADLLIESLGITATIAAIATRVPDGHGVVHDLGPDVDGPAAEPPRSLTDVLGGLSHRNDDPHHGAIDVRILTMADGTRRAIVDITGTKSWDLGASADITSLTTNGRALIGRRTAYEQGVLAAMRQAGIRPEDEVMLVGHSEGGMVAVTTARDAARSGEFRVTHVVTAGSPIGLTAGQLPSQVRVLALENRRDVVPQLDGTTNPDRPNVTTVESDHGNGTIGGNHDIGTAYLPVAADAEVSDNASVREFLHSADGYLDATRVSTHAFQITRVY